MGDSDERAAIREGVQPTGPAGETTADSVEATGPGCQPSALGLEMDDDGYPTEDSLRQIREFKAWSRAECERLLDSVGEAWTYQAFWEREGDTYKVSTGGWSGNESLVDALQDNKMFWLRCWESVRRGGHYEFELPEEPR